MGVTIVASAAQGLPSHLPAKSKTQKAKRQERKTSRFRGLSGAGPDPSARVAINLPGAASRVLREILDVEAHVLGPNNPRVTGTEEF